MEPTHKPASETKFEKPRHWVGVEELKPEYWTDEAIQTRNAQEFYDKPIETLEKLEAMDRAGVSRRDFLTVMGASMAMASFACARRPVNKIIPYVVQPQEMTPGNPLYFSSTCRECANACGLIVKTREGRPIKLEGNDAHPVNGGSVCAQGQASVLNLYDPDRLKKPMKGSKGGSKSSVNWAEADSLVVAALKAAKKVRIVSLPESGESSRRAIKEFMSSFADAKWIEADPSGLDEVAEGQNESYGTRVVPEFAFDRAEMVVSIGADFLGTWGNPVGNAQKWSKMRKLAHAKDALSKLVVFESNMSITGASSDERFPILPGSEVAVGLAIAHEMIVVQKKGKFAGNIDVSSYLSGSLEEWSAKAGSLDGEKVKKVASELWEARGKSIVVGSGSRALQVVVNLLNSNLENDGRTIDGTANVVTHSGNIHALISLQSELEAGLVDVLIVHGTNPVYFLPKGQAFAEAMKKAKIVVSVSDRIDETAAFADVVLAENHYLESWGDAHPNASTYSVQQPTIAPLFDTRCFEDMMVAWVRGGVKTSGLLAQVAQNPKGSFYDYVKENWKQTLYPTHGKGQGFNDFWESTLQVGVLVAKAGASRERPFKTGSLKIARDQAAKIKSLSLGKKSTGPVMEASGLLLGLYFKGSLGDGRSANNAWLQEMPDPVTTVTWDNHLNIGPAHAAELGLQTNDVVLLKGAQGSFEIPVKVQPGIAKGAVTLALGYGRTSAGSVGNGVGQNAYVFSEFGNESGLSFSGSEVSIAKTGKKYQLAETQLHHKIMGRPILNEISFDEFKKNPNASMETEPPVKMDKVPTLWSEPFDYSKSPHRWMMAVDLNSCTGCGACVVACQAENNTPVVGRDRVRQSREMHWMRIDRYYMGDENNPTVAFQPMMCQHCENAPCETVCPVVATSHSEDGLNQMTYSRCVGTRYCQNNCPYKTRRFNFFDHWKDVKDTANMVWNPDVTVRSRGIMEKCTFCVQRINEAKGKAKDRKTSIKDSDLKTACQQTCPTDAIIFGNVNDKDSAIHAWIKNPRAFRSMEVLNTRPAVHYLTKVRNAEGEAAEGGAHHGHS
ncbi:MAG: Fe-S-cluster-containing hydrogenase [Bdellovibrionales bacterium]|nr:Fe-S-cluster-containing hydrogenase [Bdellovibrionales bacterium]